MVMNGLKRFSGLIAAACLLVLPFSATAGPVRLSLQDALDMARENNSTLKAAASRVEQAEARYLQTRKAYLPSVELSETMMHTNDPAAVFSYKLRQRVVNPVDLGYTERINDPDALTNFQLGLEVRQPILNLDAWNGRKAAEVARSSAGYELERAAETIELEVKKAYYALVLSRSNLEAVNRSIEAMSRHDREARKAYSKGLITRSDKLSTGVRLAELNEQKLVIRDEIRNAEDALRFLLRYDDDSPIVPEDGLEVQREHAAADAAVSVDERADLKALEAYTRAAEYRTQMAEAAALPRVNAFVQTNWNDNAFPGLDEHNWTVGLSVNWMVFDGYETIGKQQEARARELESRYLYEEARDRSRFDIRRASRMLQTAASRIDVARQSLEEARVSLDYIGERYRAGQAMTFELLGREAAYTRALMRLNRARYDYIMARHELQYARGS
ncbi:TolC family protein [Prosthecochloris sp. N3]|uniref:TolC family protein n=2 Tax=Prosthecochloris ethylica TaxID=2743976 RepID=A0ABR9XQU3_9CHLB|nr:TolC family protein [Prosthecochloris ethylica]MBF0636391.1 TolC family protein [Prosthecochloris ethylica]NUK47565.1 TolC family protein [Prosthecochloris ethylica]